MERGRAYAYLQIFRDHLNCSMLCITVRNCRSYSSSIYVLDPQLNPNRTTNYATIPAYSHWPKNQILSPGQSSLSGRHARPRASPYRISQNQILKGTRHTSYLEIIQNIAKVKEQGADIFRWLKTQYKSHHQIMLCTCRYLLTKICLNCMFYRRYEATTCLLDIQGYTSQDEIRIYFGQCTYHRKSCFHQLKIFKICNHIASLNLPSLCPAQFSMKFKLLTWLISAQSFVGNVVSSPFLSVLSMRQLMKPTATLQ